MLVHLQYRFHCRESRLLVISFAGANLGTPEHSLRVLLAPAPRADRHKKTPLSKEWR
jgi:hypothetical protein